jgi:hypothetical protein
MVLLRRTTVMQSKRHSRASPVLDCGRTERKMVEQSFPVFRFCLRVVTRVDALIG